MFPKPYALLARGCSAFAICLQGQRVADIETILRNRGRVRDIRPGPDGLIYIALDEHWGATLFRLEPAL